MKKIHLDELLAIADEMAKLEERAQAVLDAEREIWDNRSEAWQEGETGEAESALIDALEDGISDMSNARETISNVATGDL